MKLYNTQTFNLSNINLDQVLMNFDGVPLYPSAMADTNSEYPKVNQQEYSLEEKKKTISCNSLTIKHSGRKQEYLRLDISILLNYFFKIRQ